MTIIKPDALRNGKLCGSLHHKKTVKSMSGGIVAGDYDMALRSRNSRLKSIGGSIEELSKKMKGKQNLTL